jgi:hypothetical protein
VKQWALFAVGSLVIIAAGAWLLGLIFAAPGEHRALAISAGVAWLVQLCGFGVARRFMATNLMAGWGLGMLLRLVTLTVYGLVVVKSFALPAAAALVGLATFFFTSMLIEPPLLRS